MTRFTTAKDKIGFVEDDTIREALMALYHLIEFVWELIPEVE